MSTEAAKAYFEALPPKRRHRLEELSRHFREAVPDATLTMRYKLPAFERGENWVCLGSQKGHLSVYYCSPSIVDSVVASNPQLNCGKGCVRIRDTQEVPVDDLVAAFVRAMGA